MSQGHGNKAVVVAVIVNLFIAIIKGISAFMSGSGAMFAEFIHSVADVGNQALLLVGVHRSQKPADDKFNFGYAQEKFCWALISACGIFFLGAGVTIYHGIHGFMEQHTPEIDMTTLGILGVSFFLESISFVAAWKEIKHLLGGKVTIKGIKNSDTTTLAILLEDSAALVGMLIASVSIILTRLTGAYYWDAGGSILVGVLLGFVAVFLAKTNMQYLVEKAMPEDLQNTVKSIVAKYGSLVSLKTSTLAVDTYRVNVILKIEGSEEMLGKFLINTREQIEQAILSSGVCATREDVMIEIV